MFPVRQISAVNRQTSGRKVRFDPLLILPAGKPKFTPQRIGEANADGNAFAMQQASIVAVNGFECMAKRVAEVQQTPHAGLALVLCHHVRLDGARPGDGFDQRALITAFHRRPFAFQPLEERAIPQTAVFCDLSIARAPFAFGQGFEQVGIDINRLWAGGTAPTKFLPLRELIPVLPPTEESTCAKSVVGT